MRVAVRKQGRSPTAQLVSQLATCRSIVRIQRLPCHRETAGLTRLPSYAGKARLPVRPAEAPMERGIGRSNPWRREANRRAARQRATAIRVGQ